MIGKKKLLASALTKLNAVPAIASARRAFSDDVTILAYHRVLDVPDEDAFPFDIELVSASVGGFAEQMEHLRRHYRPTSFGEVLRRLAAGEPVPRGSVIVTFDDGFDDNYLNAFPVLKRLGMPATIFVSTGYVDEGDLFWYDKLAYAFLTGDAEVLRRNGYLPAGGPTDTRARRAAVRATVTRLKRVPNSERIEFLRALFEHVPGSSGWRGDGRSAPLTWDQVREMSRNGIEFGSHTVSHPVLAMVDEEQLLHELAHSKARIEAETGRAVEVIAYPVGGREHFDDRVQRGVAKTGYRLGASYIPGVQSPREWDRTSLPRLHVERDTTPDYFRALMAAPRLFG